MLLFWTSKGDFKEEDAWRTWGEGEKGQSGGKKQPSLLEVSHGYSSLVFKSRWLPGKCPLKGPQQCSGGAGKVKQDVQAPTPTPGKPWGSWRGTEGSRWQG